MASTSPALGAEVRRVLIEYGIESPIIHVLAQEISDHQKAGVEQHCRRMLAQLGMDLQREEVRETPRRIAKMYCDEIFWGMDYNCFPAATTFPVKEGEVDEMVAVKCSVKSMCEHHLLPILGCAHIAYLPGERLLGLSKFNRVTEFFCRRPQVQERLTQQVYRALQFILRTESVAVVIKARHLCVEFRGAEDQYSETTTSALGGKFRTVPELRQEFIALTRNGGQT